MSQVTKGEEATITSGRAFDVIGKRSIINFDRQQKSEEASIMIEINNTLDYSYFHISMFQDSWELIQIKS